MHLISKIHVAGAMHEFFCQKIQLSIRTIQDFSIVIISKFVLLAIRCISPYVDFLMPMYVRYIKIFRHTGSPLHTHRFFFVYKITKF